jgi:mono/diheme cytochrome c family protein
MAKFAVGVLVGMVLLPALAGVAGLLGWISVDAKAVPSGWETSLAHSALDRAAARAPRQTNPYPATDENLLAGMKIFQNACAGCHGDPTQSSDYGAAFYPHVPQFAARPPKKPDWQLYWIIKNGVRFSGMSAWDGQWGPKSEERIWKAALFLSRLESLPPRVAEEWHKKPPS